MPVIKGYLAKIVLDADVLLPEDKESNNEDGAYIIAAFVKAMEERGIINLRTDIECRASRSLSEVDVKDEVIN